MAPVVTAELTSMVTDQLDVWGVTRVILGPGRNHELQLDLLTKLLGEPDEQFEDVTVWDREFIETNG